MRRHYFSTFVFLKRFPNIDVTGGPLQDKNNGNGIRRSHLPFKTCDESQRATSAVIHNARSRPNQGNTTGLFFGRISP